MKVFDCSNSVARPNTRGYGGPVENAVVTMLKKYGREYGVEFTYDAPNCDLIFTNDVFPRYELGLGKPLVKRMDGIFWREDLIDRNVPYNLAATDADHVIFVSDFSRQSLRDLYPLLKLKSSSVIVNWVDEELFPKNFCQQTCINLEVIILLG